MHVIMQTIVHIIMQWYDLDMTKPQHSKYASHYAGLYVGNFAVHKGISHYESCYANHMQSLWKLICKSYEVIIQVIIQFSMDVNMQGIMQVIMKVIIVIVQVFIQGIMWLIMQVVMTCILYIHT